jgi:magnesium-protoporphyrin IX monomethyl ester (oxidative) cyclase
LDPDQFNREVIHQTNQTAARAFPAVLDTHHPQFFERLYHCSLQHRKLQQIDASQRPAWIKPLLKLPIVTMIV